MFAENHDTLPQPANNFVSVSSVSNNELTLPESQIHNV